MKEEKALFSRILHVCRNPVCHSSYGIGSVYESIGCPASPVGGAHYTDRGCVGAEISGKQRNCFWNVSGKNFCFCGFMYPVFFLPLFICLSGYQNPVLSSSDTDPVF